MKKKGHIIFAAIISFLFIYLTIYLGLSWFDINWKSISIVSIIVVFYSVLPDIDHKNSTITWWFFGAGMIGLLFGIFELIFGFNKPQPLIVLSLATFLLLVIFISGNFLKHRGIIHTVQVGIMASIPIYFLFHSFFYPLMAYIVWHSHLIGDGFLFKIR